MLWSVITRRPSTVATATSLVAPKVCRLVGRSVWAMGEESRRPPVGHAACRKSGSSSASAVTSERHEAVSGPSIAREARKAANQRSTRRLRLQTSSQAPSPCGQTAGDWSKASAAMAPSPSRAGREAILRTRGLPIVMPGRHAAL